MSGAPDAFAERVVESPSPRGRGFLSHREARTILRHPAARQALAPSGALAGNLKVALGGPAPRCRFWFPASRTTLQTAATVADQFVPVAPLQA